MHYMLQMLYTITYIITFSAALDISNYSVNVSRESEINNTMQNNGLPSEYKKLWIYIPPTLIFGLIVGYLISHYYSILWNKFKTTIYFWRIRNKHKYVIQRRNRLRKSNKTWNKRWVNYDKRTKKWRSEHKSKNILIRYQKKNESINQQLTDQMFGIENELINDAGNENKDESKNTCRIKHSNPEFTVSTDAQKHKKCSSTSSDESYCTVIVKADVHTKENDN